MADNWKTAGRLKFTPHRLHVALLRLRSPAMKERVRVNPVPRRRGKFARCAGRRAGHADPRTTRRYDRARHNLDQHPTYVLAGLVK
jgi:hypothetical protein